MQITTSAIMKSINANRGQAADHHQHPSVFLACVFSLADINRFYNKKTEVGIHSGYFIVYLEAENKLPDEHEVKAARKKNIYRKTN